jgi:hypothetical protein
MNNQSIPQGTIRISATLPRILYSKLNSRAGYEGRSLSNLISFILESSMQGYQESKF